MIPDEAIAALCYSLPFDVEERPQVLEKLHLGAEVIGVVLNVALVGPEVLHDIFLLTELNRFKVISNVFLLTFALKNSW